MRKNDQATAPVAASTAKGSERRKRLSCAWGSKASQRPALAMSSISWSQ